MKEEGSCGGGGGGNKSACAGKEVNSKGFPAQYIKYWYIYDTGLMHSSCFCMYICILHFNMYLFTTCVYEHSLVAHFYLIMIRTVLETCRTSTSTHDIV